MTESGPNRRPLLLAALALSALPSVAAAQPSLTGATLFLATVDGSNLDPATPSTSNPHGSWRTNPGALNTYHHLFFSTAPDAAFAAGSVLNDGTALNQPLGLGANTFYFYATGNDRLGRPNFGTNLWFGSPGGYTCATPPDISAYVTPGAGQTPSPNGSATTTSQCVPASGGSPYFIPGANTLSWSNGSFLVQLTDFRVLAEGYDASGSYTLGGPSTIDRVGYATVGADGTADTYGTLTLQVTAVTPSAVPEPSTWTMLGAGLLALGGVAGRRRRV